MIGGSVLQRSNSFLVILGCSLQQVPEESQLVFREHHAHIESCCFITNGEFLSGFDDGCVSL